MKFKKFNRICCIDRKDPSEGIGSYLSCFSLYQTYSNIKDTKAIQDEIYNNLLENIEKKTPDYIKSSLIEFADARHKRIEGSRKYIIVERETPRKTQIKTLIRILAQKDTLYLGIDSYILGGFSFYKFIKRIWFTLAILLTVNFMFIPLIGIPLFFLKGAVIDRNTMAYLEMYANQYASIFFISLLIIILIFLWKDVIKGIVHQCKICLSFRQCFNKIEEDESFNTDDIFLFFKSILPIVIFTIKECFKKITLTTKLWMNLWKK